MSQLVAKGLSLHYGERAALAELDLELAAGARLAVLGASGAGKTSLLRLIAGLERPSAGTLELSGQAASAPGKLLLAPEARRVGFVFQDLALWPHLSVEGTLRYVAPGTAEEGRQRARELAGVVGLGERLDAFPDQLSGGEQQRLALARALASDPRLLLLDEPFAHLDAALRRELQDQLLELAEATPELSLIAVTHQADEALALGRELLILGGGRARDRGEPAELIARPRAAETVELLELGAVVSRSGLEALGLSPELAEESADAARVLVRPQQIALAEGEEGAAARVERSRPRREGGLDCALALGEVRLRAFLPELPAGELRVTLEGPLWGLA